MNASVAPAGLLAPLRRLWWIPLVVGIIAGVVVGSLAGSSVGHETRAVVNTRTATPLPNERVDLINDLTTVVKVSSVVSAVAENFDLTADELRDGLTISRLETSTFVDIRLTTDRGDDSFRREVVQAFVDEVVAYLEPSSPSMAFENAEEAESAAIDAYYAAIEDNGGLIPSDTLNRLQARLIEARAERNTKLVSSLEASVPRATRKAAEFEKLRAQMRRAGVQLEAITQSDAESSASGVANLEISFVDSSGAQGVLSSLALRRGVAAGLAAALVTAGIVVLVSGARARKRERP
jgi:hypothetical protein